MYSLRPARFRKRSTLVCAVFLAATFGAADLPSVAAKETILKDSSDAQAWVYSPDRPDPNKTYWLVVGVHGKGGNGQGAGGVANWIEMGDVVVLGPSFVDGYQAGNGEHEQKLKELIATVAKLGRLHPKVFLHGFSGGAQFAHRFAFRNPDMVAGVSAHSAGSWDAPNLSAKGFPWAISCGDRDTAKSTPTSPLTRIDWFKNFATAMTQQQFNVEARIWPNVGHQQSRGALEMAARCLERVRRQAAAEPMPR